MNYKSVVAGLIVVAIAAVGCDNPCANLSTDDYEGYNEVVVPNEHGTVNECDRAGNGWVLDMD